MSNSKTIPSASKPQARNGWVRKCELDDYLDRHLPIPTQVISNEEYIPLPQTRGQRAVEHRLLELGTLHARKLGIDRRQFFRTSCGMAAGFAALNSVFESSSGSTPQSYLSQPPPPKRKPAISSLTFRLITWR